MFRLGRGKGKKAEKTNSSQPPQPIQDDSQEQSEAQGFICPICKINFQGPLELQNHFEVAHTEGGTPVEPPTVEVTKNLISFDSKPDTQDPTDHGADKRRSETSMSEVYLLQQELADLAARLKEEIWYTSQLKQELDRVSEERDKAEEEKSMVEEEYGSKLRSAESGFLQVAEENEKLKEELKYVDYKTQKERDTKLKNEIDGIKEELAAKEEQLRNTEEESRRILSEMKVKDEFLEALKRELEDRPSDSYIKDLEIKNKQLEEQVMVMEKSQGQELKAGEDKWTSKFEDMNNSISSLQLKVKELEIERNAKTDQINSLETALKTATESNKQSQDALLEKHQQTITLQHTADEANASVKEKENFIKYLEKQIEELKAAQSQETLAKQNLQQDIRSKENQLEEEKRTIVSKDEKIQELQSSLEKKKEDIERIETEKSELLQQIEAGEGVQTAINQLKQEKEKLIDGVASLEKEMEDQSKRFQSEVITLREEKIKVNEELQLSSDKVATLETELKQLIEQFDTSKDIVDDLRKELKAKGDQLLQTESEKSARIGKLEAELKQEIELRTSQEQELVSVKEQNEKAFSEASSLRSSLSQLEANLRSKEQEIAGQKEKIDNLKSQLEIKENSFKDVSVSLEQVTTDSRAANEQAAKQILELSDQIKEQLQQIKNDGQKLIAKDSEIGKLKMKATEIQNQHLKCQEQLTAREKELDDAINRIKDSENDLAKTIEEKKVEKEKVMVDIREKESKFQTALDEKDKLFSNREKELNNQLEKMKEDLLLKEKTFTEQKDGLLEKYEKELSSVKDEVKKHQEELATLNATAKKEEEEKNALQSELSKTTEEKNLMLSSLEQKDSTFHELQRQYEIVQQELKKACEGCKNYELQLCRLQETYGEKGKQIEQLIAEKESLNAEIKTLQEAVESKSKETESLKTSSSQEIDELKTEGAQLKEVKSVLEARVLELDDELKEAYNKYDILKQEKEAVCVDLVDQKGFSSQIVCERDKAVNDLSLIEGEIKEREALWDKEKISLKEQLDTAQSEKEALKKEVKDSQDKVAKEKQRQEEMKSTADKIQDVLKGEATALRKKIENLEKEKENIMTSKEQLESSLNMQMNTVKENIQAARQSVIERDEKIKKLDERVTAFESEKDEMHGEIAVLEAQIQHLGDEKRALSERILKSEELLKQRQEKLTEYKQRLEQSVSALHELGRENQNLQVKHNIQLTRQWEDDQDVTNCKACNKQFSVTVRKHHCRQCGSIFCNECSSYNIQVAASKKPVRCCLNCFNELGQLQGRRSSQISMT